MTDRFDMAMGAAALVSLSVIGGGCVTRADAQAVQWPDVATCPDSVGAHLNASNFSVTCGSSVPADVATFSGAPTPGDIPYFVSSGGVIGDTGFPASSIPTVGGPLVSGDVVQLVGTGGAIGDAGYKASSVVRFGGSVASGYLAEFTSSGGEVGQGPAVSSLTSGLVSSGTIGGAVTGSGAVSSGVLALSAVVTSVFSGGSGLSVVTANTGGQITAGRALAASDISAALGGTPVESIVVSGGDVTASGVSGSAVNIVGVLNSVTAGGTGTKVVVNSKGLTTSVMSLAATDLPLTNGGAALSFSGTVQVGLYPVVIGFPYSSGNLVSVYAGLASGSMTYTLESATSQGATLSAVAGCSGITVSSGGSAAPTSCTSTPISRGGQIFVSVSAETGASAGGIEPVWNHTGA